MSVRHKLDRLRRLSRRDRGCLARAWVLLLLADLALRMVSFARVRRLFDRCAPGLRWGPPADPRRVAERVQELVAVAARHHLYGMGCLRRVLAASPLLRRHGVVPVVRVGVKREGEALLAHAWLELDGQPVGEDLEWLQTFSAFEGES